MKLVYSTLRFVVVIDGTVVAAFTSLALCEIAAQAIKKERPQSDVKFGEVDQ